MGENCGRLVNGGAWASASLGVAAAVVVLLLPLLVVLLLKLLILPLRFRAHCPPTRAVIDAVLAVLPLLAAELPFDPHVLVKMPSVL